jgi:hypothetical protein
LPSTESRRCRHRARRNATGAWHQIARETPEVLQDIFVSDQVT